KAYVQARYAQGINPALQVDAIVARLESVPLGLFRSDVILGCLDSKDSRRSANEIAWRLGVPFLDAGVEPSLTLARVNGYMPAADQPCFECALTDSDYAELGAVHPCRVPVAKSPQSDSPASLGTLAGALMVIEAEKLLAGNIAESLIGRQV